LDAKLTSGDCCEIIVDKNRKTPNPDWLDFVKTGTARHHIKNASKNKLTRWIFELGKSDKDGKEKGKAKK
jgi:(p)ppGpp synthase/HD superfamily hydrolase